MTADVDVHPPKDAAEETNKEDQSLALIERPIPDESTWTLLRESYLRVKKKSGVEEALSQAEKMASSKRTGFSVPFEIQRAPGKGRGIFATSTILEGTVVMSETPTAYFYTEKEWREFLSYLPHDVACDVAVWAWVHEEEEEEEGSGPPYSVGLDLGPGSLMNHGGSISHQGGTILNNGEKPEPNNLVYKEDSWDLIAAHDIQAGEEILCDYEEFHEYEHSLDWFEETCKGLAF